ncbi:MAG TPA: hypothetical protein PLE24_13910 [Chitinispirillaceae bacterium]|jgi:hypothetical protein|nr:hypothetical protein [Chitinispirillaceae bacterium]
MRNLLVFFCLLLFFFCGSAPRKGGDGPVKWKPNLLKSDFDTEPLQIYSGLKIVIPPFTDSRENKSLIGSVDPDRIAGGELVPLTTTQDIARWCRSGMLSALDYLGIESSKEGDLIIECEVTRFFISEEMNQRSEIDLRVSIRNSSGMLIWEGNTRGSSELYLRPQGSDGVWECFSNTMIYTVYNFLTESSVRDAVIKSRE